MESESKEIRELGAELFGHISYEPPKKKAKLSHKKKKKKKRNEAAWTDPDDENIKINVAKNRKLRHLRNNFNENELDAKEYIMRQRKRYKESIDDDWTKEEEEDDDLKQNEYKKDKKDKKDNKLESYQRSIKITAASDTLIADNKIAFTDLGPINSRNVHNSVITVCEFHENCKILMIGGLDKTLNLYSMEGKNNELLKKIFINDLPIRCSKFSLDGTEIIITGRRHYIYSFNLINFNLQRINKLIGRDERSWEYFEISPNNLYIIFIGIRGSLIIVSMKTKKPIKTLQISNQITMIKFNDNGDFLYILTENGIIYIFNMNTFRCIDKILFDGIVKSTCFDIYPLLNIIGIGCNSGVVSLYKYNFNKYNINNTNNMMNNRLLLDKKKEIIIGDKGGALKAIYSINNLVTTINGIQFNHDGQLMVIWSKNKKEAIRLIHVSTGKVYSNWPKDKGLSYVYKAKFSPNSGYLAVGNDRGYVKLIRLHFYGSL